MFKLVYEKNVYKHESRHYAKIKTDLIQNTIETAHRGYNLLHTNNK